MQVMCSLFLVHDTPSSGYKLLSNLMVTIEGGVYSDRCEAFHVFLYVIITLKTCFCMFLSSIYEFPVICRMPL